MEGVRELDMQSQTIIHMRDKLTSITNVKVSDGIMGDSMRERVKEFTFDHSYWSACREDSHYVAQKQVFMDLGLDVVDSAYRGYNACVFAYGQTGSGKTYTMMGNPELFDKMSDANTTYRTEVSYLEIYNEKVRDLLKTKKQQHTLRVREHPKDGPYVEGLSKHIVMNFSDIKELMDKGNASRTTAATNMNDVSSRSHAIFTVLFTQAKFSKDAPSEMHSKIHLVDLAGSERADQSGATGQRLKEGGSINKSLVTLGNVISALADMSEREHARRSVFIPYRDSVLTWLLKDSLGGNSKTIMVAAISPASCNYAESLSTLRYANRAKNIINKPTVNEDSNVKLIRELREEIARLRTLLGGHIDNIVTPKVQEKLHENEARVKVLTDEWTGKWKEMANILKEERNLELRKSGLGVVLDSELPHLIGIDDDILSTGIMLYHLKDCHTTIGTTDAPKQQDIVLSGVDMEPEHCIIEHNNGDVTLVPLGTAACTVNGIAVSGPTKLNQGAVILLGKTNMFRFNHPAEAAKLRAEFKTTRTLSMSRASLLSQSMSDLYRSTENLTLMTTGWEMEENHKELLVALDDKRRQVEEMEERLRRTEVDRLQEQGAAELELDERRRMLERLQHEAEMMKAEAQQVGSRSPGAGSSMVCCQDTRWAVVHSSSQVVSFCDRSPPGGSAD
ncbi:hypothetical protein NP493_430g01016 [Ridgeia piscesae]|uniref:Kinesin-like protein n=1 Tax=Ridgeia piscesae TaxID=27915 RepID=A0AAD9L185_RIDPI|nr:hypothetical protein NP493_430g01016 [Ridgeia piscesae]